MKIESFMPRASMRTRWADLADDEDDDGAGLSMKPEFEATVEATDAPT